MLARGLQMSSNRDFNLFSKALRHYSERLVEIQKDEEIKQGNDTLREDLNQNSKKSLELAQLIDEKKTENMSHEDIVMLKSALGLYKKDLIESKESLKKKIGIEVPLENVENEIKLIDSNMERRRWE